MTAKGRMREYVTNRYRSTCAASASRERVRVARAHRDIESRDAPARRRGAGMGNSAMRRAARLPASENGTSFSISLFSLCTRLPSSSLRVPASLPRRGFSREMQGRLSSARNETDKWRSRRAPKKIRTRLPRLKSAAYCRT